MRFKSNKFLLWTPRILSIIFILFLALFSLDIFEICNGFFDCALGLFMHNLPSLILLIILIISWKREIVGGIAFILGGLLYILFIIINAIKDGFEWYYLIWFLSISLPAFIIGILFLIIWFKKKKKTKKKKRK